MKTEQTVSLTQIEDPVTIVAGRYEERQNLWDIVRGFQIPFGAEYLRYKHRWSEEFSLGCIREYKRFAFLALAGDSDITPSVAVDEVWHLHILHTASYADLAAQCGKFLHHNPGMPTQVVKWNNQYDVTYARYREAFGEESPEQFWPRGLWKSGSIADVLRAMKEQRAHDSKEAA